MPLVLQLCIDGNGETEIASLFICNSESRVAMEAMIDAFQKYNHAWTETKVILGDKDWADRVVYAEKFPNAQLQICLYHVLRTFNREITTSKRNVTTEERSQVLELLQKLVYSRSIDEYDELYEEFCDLNFEEVTEYYNNNWHNIRDQWTMYGRNQHSNFLNTTNNRTESLNQKIKMIANRHANLLTFFEDVFTSVSVFASEKNIRAVESTMRTPRKRFENEELARYNAFVTPFIFKRIEYEYEMSANVVFASIGEDNAVTRSNDTVGHSVSRNKCSCMFHSAMLIPCRHIFKFLLSKEYDTFVPEVCAVRWTKEYYGKSHPALQNCAKLAPIQPVSFVKARIPSEMDKYRKAAGVTKDINNIVSNMSNSQFDYVYGKLCDIRNQMSLGTFDVEPNPTVCREVNASSDSPVVAAIGSTVPESTLIVTSDTDNVQNESENVDGGAACSSAAPDDSLQNLNIERIVLPPIVTSIGRPKGSGQTVIGTKRMNVETPGVERKRYSQGLLIVTQKAANNISKVAHGAVNAVKFIDMSRTDQAMTIIKWLTNMSTKQMLQRKITMGDVIQDPAMFNRLRNDGVHLQYIKKYVDTQCYKYLCNEVARLQDKPWACAKCNKNLSGYQLMCNMCLDWFHIACLGLKESEASTLQFFCTFCNALFASNKGN